MSVLISILCTVRIKWLTVGPIVSVRLHLRKVQVENHCTDFYEVWYGHYATGGDPELLEHKMKA